MVQRFYRLDQSRTTPGSGLGLALVFAVLKVHKLELTFSDNKPGLKVLISADPNEVGERAKLPDSTPLDDRSAQALEEVVA